LLIELERDGGGCGNNNFTLNLRAYFPQNFLYIVWFNAEEYYVSFSGSLSVVRRHISSKLLELSEFFQISPGGDNPTLVTLF
jgi:hypothetical protein